MLNSSELERFQAKQAGLYQKGKPTQLLWKHIENGVWARIGKKGGVSLVLRYQYQGRAQALTLGKYPETSLDESASLAVLCRGWLDNDQNPADQLPKHRTYAKVFKMAGAFTLRICIAQQWKEHTRSANPQKIINACEKYLFPALGDRLVDDITPPEWLDAFRKAADAAPEMAKKLLVTCKSAISVSRASGLCTTRALDDITARLVGIRSKARERVLSDAEIINLMQWINTSADAYYSSMARLLIMIGCRTGEARQSRCDEWEHDEHTGSLLWRVPPEHSKTGVEIVRQLSSSATPFISGLLRAAKASRSPYLLGEEPRTEHAVSFYISQLGERLSDKAALMAWTAHDLRRTVSTRMADLGVEPWVTEHSILAHAIPGVAGRYNRARLRDACRGAYDVWNLELMRLERKNRFELISNEVAR